MHSVDLKQVILAPVDLPIVVYSRSVAASRQPGLRANLSQTSSGYRGNALRETAAAQLLSRAQAGNRSW